LSLKEVVLDDATMRDRFVVCRNPDEAQRDAHIRGQIVERLETAIADTDRLSPRKRAELAGRLKTRPAYNRFLRTTPKTGLLRIDRAAIAADVKLDGKFLLRTSDPTLDAEDVALGYKQLLQVEYCRVLKSSLGLRPIRHFTEPRVRGHIAICVLAAVIEQLIGNRLRDAALRDPDLEQQHLSAERAIQELDRIRQATFTAGDRTITAITRRSALQHQILAALGVDTAAWTRPTITG
jgi:transposase